jgi:tetratricopeptide (TPR) repeat protein
MTTDNRAAEASAAFQNALDLQQRGRFDEAQRLYETVLELQPGHIHALIFLAVLALDAGQAERAIELTTQASGLDPANASAHYLMGRAQQLLRRRSAAVASYDRAIVLQPGLADVHFHRGNALSESGQFEAAVASFGTAITFMPAGVEIYNNRGNALRQLKRYDDALADYDRAIALMPQCAEAHYNRGVILAELKRHEEALASYDRATGIKTDYADAYCNRGNALTELRRVDEALASYDRAIALKADYAEAHCNRGNVLRELERLDAALASYDRAIAIKPAYTEAYCNRGNLLRDLKQIDSALDSFDRAIAITPGYAHAYFSRSFVHLLSGALEPGWSDFEWRWKMSESAAFHRRRNFPQPRWLGQVPIDGKSILLFREQGLGDVLQFCRYTTMVAELGARVILEVPPALASLLTSLNGVAQLVVEGQALPEFDYYCPLMSLPLAFKTTLSAVPSAVPYLKSSADRLQFWKDKLGERTKPRIGLVWSGGFRPNQPELWSVNNRRNIPLAKLAALNHPGLEFYSLQKGEPAESELAELTANLWDGPELRNFSSLLHDFADTAALIEQLDLVISVDTSTAHLAGALGKPVWILNRYDTCWRWLLNRTDSPWYPTVRLYRQEHPGDWDGVIQRVVADVARLTV